MKCLGNRKLYLRSMVNNFMHKNRIMDDLLIELQSRKRIDLNIMFTKILN